MKFDKKLSPIQVMVAVAVLNTACSNLPEGPGFSFTSKDNRLSGTWTIDDIEDLDQEDPLNNIETFEFEKEGDFESKFSDISYSYLGYDITISVEGEGEWEWNSDKTEIELDYTLTAQVSFFGQTQTTTEQYSREFEVLRLTSEELILEDDEGRRWELEKE